MLINIIYKRGLALDYKLKYKIRTVDFYLIIVFLLFSSVSHLIAFKIILLPFTKIPLVSATFTYMFAMTLTGLVRAYSTKRNAFKFVALEMVFVFFLIIIPYRFTLFDSPAYASIPHLNTVFNLALAVYKANFIGIFVTMILDILLFSLLFNKVLFKLSLYKRFILSSIISTGLITTIYSYITNGQIFFKLFPHKWLEITDYSVITNLISIIFYSFVCSGIFKGINWYLISKKL